MLIQYAVENYKSIKNEIIINFKSLENTNNSDWIFNVENPSYNLYKGIALLGPNASGKSNIINSMYFAVNFINNTINRKESAKINVEPFMLNSKTREQGTSFEFIFITDGIKYVYGFTVNQSHVLEEYLLAYYSNKPTTIFDRHHNNQFKFQGNDTKIQKQLANKTNLNRLYLAVAAEWGYEKVIPAYKWFGNIFNHYSELTIREILKDIVEDNSKKKKLLSILKKADFNITDIYTKDRKIESDQLDIIKDFIAKLIPDSDIANMPEMQIRIYVTHKNKQGEELSIDLTEDSTGTESFVSNVAKLLYSNEVGGIILADELGKAYHNKLTEYYLQMFKETSCTKKSLQILFSTHNTKLLNMLDAEQIYLVDKDEEGSTFIKLLDDYHIREKNIELGYLKGRYGGIPYIKE